MPSLLNASISKLNGGLQKARINIEGFFDSFEVHFNPDQYTITENGQIRSIPAKTGDKAIIQYVGGVTSTLNLTLYFDTNAKMEMGSVQQKAQDVSLITHRISNALNVNQLLNRPPIVTFDWGSTQYHGFVLKVNTTYTMFTMSGMPVRAKVDLVLQEVEPPFYVKLNPIKLINQTKALILSQDTSLWNMASNEYSDISQWKTIAQANNIMDPLNMAVGTVLKIPALNK